jgi:cell division protein FtsZ
MSPIPVKIQLGVTLTEGRGAGNKPEMGEEAARENYADIRNALKENTKMVFITAGMGGGTGTGAAPVIASLARELNFLTIAVVTIPSPSEGKKRFNQAMEGIRKMSQYVDSMLIVSNQRLTTIYGDLPASEAFKRADDIVATAVKGVAEIITIHGNVNIDFTDVQTVMQNSKVFIMGTGYATGKDRAMNAVKQALESPLLDSNDIHGTKNILLNIISGTDEISMGEIGEIIDALQEKAGQDADIIWGNGYDESLGDSISVTILATGFNTNPNNYFQKKKEPEIYNLQGINEDVTETVHYEDISPVSNSNSFTLFEEDEKKPVEPKEEQEPVFHVVNSTNQKPQPEPKENVNTIRNPKKVQPEKISSKKVNIEASIDNWFATCFNKIESLFETDERQGNTQSQTNKQ